MPDDPPPDPLTRMLPELEAACQRDTMLGWAAVVLAVVGSVGGVRWYMAFNPSPNLHPLAHVLVGACIAIPLILQIARWTRRRQEARIVPLLAGAAGLSFAQTAKTFALSVPRTLLPQGDRKGEDLIQGDLAGYQIASAEISVKTGGNRPTELFSGLVAKVSNARPLPPCVIAPEANANGGLWNGRTIDTGDMTQLRGVTDPGGRRIGIWVQDVSEGPDDQAIEAILALDRALGPEFRFFAAVCDRTATHVALSTSRDLLRIGGLLSNKQQRRQDIRRAYDDLTVPLKIAATLLGEAQPSST